MLIVVNGMYKTGSTWVYTMLSDLFHQTTVKDQWRDDNFASNIDLLKDPVGVLKAASDKDIVIKTHTYEQSYIDYLVKHDAKIIVTTRSLEQIILSHYYHFSNDKLRLPFLIYAFTVGFAKCLESALYEYYATRKGNFHIIIDHSQLKRDPALVLSKVCDKIGISVDLEELEKIVKKADMSGRNFSLKFPDHPGQDWFFKRNSKDTTSFQTFVAKQMAAFSVQAINLGPIRLFLNFLAMRFKSRSKFRRSSHGQHEI